MDKAFYGNNCTVVLELDEDHPTKTADLQDELGHPAHEGMIDGTGKVQLEVSQDGETWGDPFEVDLGSMVLELEDWAPVRQVRATRVDEDVTVTVVGR